MLDVLGAVEKARGFVHNPRVFGANAGFNHSGAGLHTGLQIAAHASSGGLYIVSAWCYSGQEIRLGRGTSSTIGSSAGFSIGSDFCFGDGAALLSSTALDGSYASGVFDARMRNGVSVFGGTEGTFAQPLYVPPGEFLYAALLTQNLMSGVGVVGVEVDPF